jgi:hypothetical protein
MNEVNEQSLPAGMLGGAGGVFLIKLCKYGVISPFHVYLSSEVLIYHPGFHSPAPRGSDKYKPTLLYGFTKL